MNEFEDRVLNTLQQVYDWCASGELQRAMEMLYEEAHRSMFLENYAAVNWLLSAFDPEKCDAIVGVGLLRATFAGHRHLHQWLPLRARIITSLEVEGKDPVRLLRGLLDSL